MTGGWGGGKGLPTLRSLRDEPGSDPGPETEAVGPELTKILGSEQNTANERN